MFYSFNLSQLLLRRSGGFAYAFQALLRAEPRNRPPSLLPKVMIKLISLARPKSIKSVFESELEKVAYEAATCRAQVHSLNVIRLTFIDSTLAPDIISYVSESLMVSFGLRSMFAFLNIKKRIF